MSDQLLEQIGPAAVFGSVGFRVSCPARPGPGRQVDHPPRRIFSLMKRRQPDGIQGFEHGHQARRVEIKQVRVNCLVRRGLDAPALLHALCRLPRLVMVDDLCPAFARRFRQHVVAANPEAVQIIEHRLHFVVKQRQPVLHTRITPAFADRHIKRVIAGRSPEHGQIFGAEPADGFRFQRDFAHGVERQFRGLAGGALRGGIELPHALERVAKEIQPYRFFSSRHENIENAAAHRIFADFANRVDPFKTVLGQTARQILHFQMVAGPRRKPEFGDHRL